MKPYRNMLSHVCVVLFVVAACYAQEFDNSVTNPDIVVEPEDDLLGENLSPVDVSDASEKPPYDEESPSDANEEPLYGEEDPSDNSAEPPYGEEGPSDASEQPPYGEEDPSDNSEEPPYGEEGPSDASEQPLYDEEGPSDASEQPPYGEEDPSDASEQPPYGEEDPSDASEQPPYGEEDPSDASEQPPHGEEDPSDASEQPPYGEEDPSDASEQPPHGEEDPSDASEQPPYGEEDPSDASEKPPNGVEDPSTGSNAGSADVNVSQRPKCNIRFGYIKIDGYCDSYVECRNYHARRRLCPDGLHFNEKARWSEYPCSHPGDVPCRGRIVQKPKPTEHCPHKFGFFPIASKNVSEKCSQYIMCSGGIPHFMKCPVSLVFNPVLRQCDWPDKVPVCKDYLGFKCPEEEEDYFEEDFGTVHNYKHETKCSYFWSCMQGQARMLRCDYGMLFDPRYGRCMVDEHAACKDYNYGSPAPEYLESHNI